MATSAIVDLSIGEVAERSGIAISALRFYEEKQLIRSQRNAQNHRRYHRDTLRRVAIIKVAQQIGIPLSEISDAFSTLPNHRTPTAKDWKKLSNHWHQQLEQRIHQLEQLRDNLGGCIGCGCLSLKECPLRNPNDSCAEQGPGPHLIA